MTPRMASDRPPGRASSPCGNLVRKCRSGQDPAKPEHRRSAWVFAALLLLSAACASDDGVTADEAACREYGDLAEMDLYSDAELREQVQQVWDEVKDAENSAVKVHARRLLAELTTGDLEGFANAGVDLGDACAEVL